MIMRPLSRPSCESDEAGVGKRISKVCQGFGRFAALLRSFVGAGPGVAGSLVSCPVTQRV